MKKNQIDVNQNNVQVISIIAYLTLVGWFVAYVLNNPRSEKASFHLRQALGVNLIFIASGVCFMVPLLGWVVGVLGYMLGLISWILGLIFALEQEEKKVPFLGQQFQEWFQAL